MSPAPTSDVFSGADHYPATSDAACVGVVGLIGIPLMRMLDASIPLLLVATVLVAAVAAGARYRLTVSADGIELVSLRAWIWPVRRRRWLLDARIDLYESLDADAPQGLCVETKHGGAAGASDCFGPAREGRVRALHAAASAALERHRAAAPPCPPELRHARLAPQSALLDLPGAARHPSGRLREVRSLGPVVLGALEIPPGSLFRFNVEPIADPRFIDPRRDDVLVEVQVAEPVVLYGRRTNPGAVLRFLGEDRPLLTEGAFEPDVEIDGRRVRGDAVLGFRADGRLHSFTLARELRVGDLALPAGSKFYSWEGGRLLPARWSCWLGAALALPETTLSEGDGCELSVDLTRLTAISPRRDIVLSRGRVRGGVMPIPVTPDGRVDVAGCRKLSLLL
jgi:hypothetical protein